MGRLYILLNQDHLGNHTTLQKKIETVFFLESYSPKSSFSVTFWCRYHIQGTLLKAIQTMSGHNLSPIKFKQSYSKSSISYFLAK
uniref:CSON014181 protein n=1 Tax=Culicoides sonorensis TaxID=179676 RepID=A0A336MDW5_CULSO